MEKFRWAFIGSGMIARTVAKQILASGKHEVVSVYSRSYENACALAKKIGAEACNSISQAVSRGDVDGVYVCTLNSAHFDNAVPAIVAGKPVLIEKPFVLTSGDAEKLFAAAKEKRVYIAEAMWTWYNPVARKVSEWVKEGRIGDITRIDIDFRLNLLLMKRHRQRLLDASTGGGALYDLGVYPLAYCYMLLGAPQNISSKLKMHPGGVDTAAEITLGYKNAICNIKVAIDKLRPERAVITGTKGSITVPRFHAANKAVLNAGSKEVFKAKGNYVNEFDEVAREITSGQKTSAFVPPQATIEVLRILEEAGTPPRAY